MSWMQNYFLDLWTLVLVIVDCAIALGLLLLLRAMMGIFFGVNTYHELSVKDNHDFGLMFGGAILSQMIVLQGVVSGGSTSGDLVSEIFYVALYGLMGMLLIKAGRAIQDYWTLKLISIKKEIEQNNLSVACVDVANALSTALILQSVLKWESLTGIRGIFEVLVGFVFSQGALFLMMFIRFKQFADKHPGMTLPLAFKQNHLSLGVRYLGQTVGAAVALTAVQSIFVVSSAFFLTDMVWWVLLCLIILSLHFLLNIGVKRILLGDLPLDKEIVQEHNVGLAFVEAGLSLGVGILIVALFS